jgi:hypothetical protein
MRNFTLLHKKFQALLIYPILLISLIFLLLNATLPQHYFLFNYPFYDIHRILELLIFAVMGLALLTSSDTAHEFLQVYQRLPRCSRGLIPLFFIFGLISSFHTGMILESFLWVAHLTALFFLAIYIASYFQKNPLKISQTILTFLSISLGYYLFLEWANYAITQYAFHFLGNTFSNASLNTDILIQNLRFPGYSNPRFLGQVLSWLLPLAVLPYLFLSQKNFEIPAKNSRHNLNNLNNLNNYLKAGGLIIAIGLWQMFWMSQSRALYLELAITAFIIPVLFKKQALAYHYLKAQGTAMLLGLALYILLYHWGYSLPERSLAESVGDHGRLAIWRLSLSLIFHHPFLGIGPLNFIHYAGQPFNISHPHNAFLLITTEWGIPAGMLFLFLILWALKNWIKFATYSFNYFNSLPPPLSPSSENILNHSKNQLLIIALTASILSGLINAQFSGTLVMPTSQICLSLISGWALGIYQNHQNAQKKLDTKPNSHANLTLKSDYQKQSPSTSSKIILRVLTLIMAIVILKGVFPRVLHLPEIEEMACEKAVDQAYPTRCPMIPSYWADHAGDES